VGKVIQYSYKEFFRNNLCFILVVSAVNYYQKGGMALSKASYLFRNFFLANYKIVLYPHDYTQSQDSTELQAKFA